MLCAVISRSDFNEQVADEDMTLPDALLNFVMSDGENARERGGGGGRGRLMGEGKLEGTRVLLVLPILQSCYPVLFANARTHAAI